MIVEMQHGASQAQVDAVIARARGYGFEVQLNQGTDKVVVAVLGSDTGHVPTANFEVLPGVASVTRIMRPYKLASREFRGEPTQVRVGNVTIGGPRIVVMAGPCSIESWDQLSTTARHVVGAGASVVRGGAFKPRSSPFSFQGMGFEGADLLRRIGDELDVPIVSEVTDCQYVERMAREVDILQIGARNMQNYTLLRAVGETNKPCILKRGLAATVTEWLQAADYVLAAGTSQVILCERGNPLF